MSSYQCLSKINFNLEVFQIEEIVIQYWDDINILEKFYSNISDPKVVHLDGPPFANGLPHFGHGITSAIKDMRIRFDRMNGKHIITKLGWDCHGLPAEMGAEKELGISGKIEIEKYGIDKFNNYCESSVIKYSNEWRTYIKRQGRIIDLKPENEYKTMDLGYMESVISAFKFLYDKGLVYSAMRVMPYSWKCETPLSDFETRLDNSYKTKESKAVSVLFKLTNYFDLFSKLNIKNDNIDSCFFIAWTTTAWTLPSNLFLCVGEKIEYVLIKKDDTSYILAKDLLHKYEKEIGSEIIVEFLGKDLIGTKYEPIFKYFEGRNRCFEVYSGDFVTTEDGSGVVHCAPGFGEDDYNLAIKNNIDPVCPIDNSGHFIFPIEDYLGVNVFDTIDSIIIYLKKKKLWLKTEQYIHNYPFCWRTDTPLIYRLIPSWYIKVTSIKDRMSELNMDINWIPGHIKNGLFGKWLSNARDWSISRNRYWGCPIPIWESDDPKYPCIKVFGSIKEMENFFNVKIENLHRPFVDSLVSINPNDPSGKSKLRRISDVFDCWFESGSTPFAQQNYLFDNHNVNSDINFTANFVAEYVAQTRGWFYTMMVLSTALFDKIPFENCICHGVLVGTDGQKLSKRLKNFHDPMDIFNSIGSDAVRWFFLSSGITKGNELMVDENSIGIKTALKNIIKPIINACKFFSTYAEIDKVTPKKISIEEISSELDKYLIQRTYSLINSLIDCMENYDSQNFAKEVELFIDVLNNFYIRRSREKFWKSEIDKEKKDAYNTLFTSLSTLVKLIAPFIPMISEAVNYILFKTTNSNKEEYMSVHLMSYPKKDINLQSISSNGDDISRIRSACNSALSIRNALKIRIRQPLEEVTFVGVSKIEISEEMKQIFLDELNVKKWVNLPQSKLNDYVDIVPKLNIKEIATRIPELTKQILNDFKNNLWKLNKENNILIVGNTEIYKNEFNLHIKPKKEYENISNILDSQDAVVILKPEITKELLTEGVTRDIIRFLQNLRKEINLNIIDQINTQIFYQKKDQWIVNIIQSTFLHLIEKSTLSKKIELINLENIEKDNIILDSENAKLNIEIDNEEKIQFIIKIQKNS